MGHQEHAKAKPSRGASSDSFRSHHRDHKRPLRQSSSSFTSEDPPPPYSPPEEEVKQDSKAQKAGEGSLPLASRIGWSLSLLLPLLGATIVLFLITASSSSLRTDFSVLKISVAGSSFDSLYKVTEEASSGDTSAIANAASWGMDRREEGSEGTLTLGVWGWCVNAKEFSRSVCSSSSGWYDMDDVLSSASQSGMQGDDFNSVYIHALILHGLALLSAMLSIVPAILNVWRRYYHDNSQYEAGWFQHGTILAASLLALGAWIIDKMLSHSVDNSLSRNKVEEGPAVTLVGVAALLLVISFLISAVPVLCRFVDKQAQYIRKWTTLEDSSAEAARVRQAEAMVDLEMGEGSGRRRRGRKRARWKNRMTRMFVSDEGRRRRRR